MESSVGRESGRLLLAEIRRYLSATLSGLAGEAAEAAAELPAELNTRLGVFVTIKKHGDLRGCIGNFSFSIPLLRNARDMAVAAALEDPRFPPVSPAELKSCTLEISVLSPPVRIASVEEIQVGVHGLMLTKGYQRGVLLPQVAAEYGWSREEFLRHTCLKAGLSPNEWRSPGVTIETFTARIFSEEESEQG